MAVVDCASYVKGSRVHDAVRVEEAVARPKHSNGFAWVGLVRPTDEELDRVGSAFNVHALAIEDATKGQ